MQLEPETIRALRDLGISPDRIISTKDIHIGEPCFIETRRYGPFKDISLYLTEDMEWTLVKDYTDSWCLIPFYGGNYVLPFTFSAKEMEVVKEVFSYFGERLEDDPDIEADWEEMQTDDGESFINVFNAITSKLGRTRDLSIEKKGKVFDLGSNIFTC